MKPHIALAAALLLPLFTSCASLRGEPRVYIMQNPETMEFQNCEVGVVGLDRHYKNNEACVKALQEQGWIIWGTL